MGAAGRSLWAQADAGARGHRHGGGDVADRAGAGCHRPGGVAPGRRAHRWLCLGFDRDDRFPGATGKGRLGLGRAVDGGIVRQPDRATGGRLPAAVGRHPRHFFRRWCHDRGGCDHYCRAGSRRLSSAVGRGTPEQYFQTSGRQCALADHRRITDDGDDGAAGQYVDRADHHRLHRSPGRGLR
ncbi:hypothetical protein D3C80_1433160 [compost metagenome]